VGSPGALSDVIPARVAGIHSAESSGARGALDSGDKPDKPRYDIWAGYGRGAYP